MTDRTCVDCGAPSSNIGGGVQLCEACRLERKRASARRAYRKGRQRDRAVRRGDCYIAECRYCHRVFQHIVYTRLRVQCDECTRKMSGQARQRWADRNPEKVRAIKRRHMANGGSARAAEHQKEVARFRKYGVTKEWYDATLANQGGRCGNPGCRATEAGGRWNTWHIDHDHVSGEVRGLLCDACNKGLGHFGDDEERLRGILEYLSCHRQLRLIA